MGTVVANRQEEGLVQLRGAIRLNPTAGGCLFQPEEGRGGGIGVKLRNRRKAPALPINGKGGAVAIQKFLPRRINGTVGQWGPCREAVPTR